MFWEIHLKLNAHRIGKYSRFSMIFHIKRKKQKDYLNNEYSVIHITQAEKKYVFIYKFFHDS